MRMSSAHQVGVAELRADLGRPAGQVGVLPFANDKRLEVLSGTNSVNLLKEQPGTAALPSSRHLIRPCWRCPLVLWLALPGGNSVELS